MADKKISEFDPAGTLDGNEIVPLLQAGVNKRTTISTLLSKQHGHAISDVTGLQTALDGKSATSHTHDDRYYTETETDTLLGGKSATGHTHTASNITDFQTTVSANTDVAANTTARHTHANSAALAAVSGTNTGDQDLSSYATLNGVEALANKTLNSPVIDTLLKIDKSTGNPEFDFTIGGVVKAKTYWDNTNSRLTFQNTANNNADAIYFTDHITTTGNIAATGTVGGSNLSGTNTGDNATNTQYSGLATSKQDTLVSGTNIKTINGSSVLGSGDLVVSGSGAAWGGITGTLSSQTDLNTALSGKASTAHASTHASGGSDPITTATPIDVKKAGVTTGTRRGVNFVEGAGITITTADDSGADDVDVTIATKILTAKNSSPQAITGAIGDVTGLAVSLAANTTYRVYVNIPISTSTGTSPTLQLGFTGPASPTVVNLRRIQMTSATAVANAVITSFTTFAAAASVANTHHTIEGTIVTGANAGTLQLRAAAAGTTPSITIAQGASIVAIAV